MQYSDKREQVSRSWIKHFKQNQEYCQLRFKILNKGFGGYPPFSVDASLIDEVDLDTFVRKEWTRIPLFIGNQFGINPWLYGIPNFFSEDKIVAIGGKSVLSGHIAGLGIYKIKADSRENKWVKLISFTND